MKRIFSICFAALLLLCIRLPSEAAAADSDIPIDITVNGQYIRSDANAYLSGGTTYVPIRMLCEAFGAEHLVWEESSKTVTITASGSTCVLSVDSSYAVWDGSVVAVGNSVRQIGGRTFAPIRFLCTLFGADILWNQTYYTAEITKAGVSVPTHLHCNDYGYDEIFWLARIIEAESGGEPLLGKIAVGNVVLNRVASAEFPNTIYGVIFDKENGVQFQPVLNGTVYNTPSSDSIIAAKRALTGDAPAEDALYFLNPRTASNFWIVNNRVFHSSIANHDFYL